MPNWDSVGFAIGQIGLSQIQKSTPDLNQQNPAVVAWIVRARQIQVDKLWRSVDRIRHAAKNICRNSE